MNNVVLEIVFGLIGGLGLFLFGMKLLSGGLRNVAGDRLKGILSVFTKNPFIALLAGAGITAFLQSSSAVSVFLVGFVNASLLTLKQALGIILGMNIGTTITAWFISTIAVFKITSYALPAVGFGFALSVLPKSRSLKMWGQILLGFGIMFVGLGLMGELFAPLKSSEAVISFFDIFGKYPILGVFFGALATVLFQSSSASIALVQMLAFTGVISFPVAVPLILGDNIGTTCTAMLSSVGTNVEARRVARAHLLFNLIGVGYMLIFVYNGWYLSFIEFLIPGEITSTNIMIHIALAHTIFNIFNALVFLPFLKFFEKIVVKMVKSKPEEISMAPHYLEEHLLDSPPVAFEQINKEIIRMLDVSRMALKGAVKGLFKGDVKSLDTVPGLEEVVDNLQKEITEYMIALSRKDLSDDESQSIPVLIHMVNDIERIGDHAENIMESAERKIDQKLFFSDEAFSQLQKMYLEVDKMMEDVCVALREKDAMSAKRALHRENVINKLQIDCRNDHVDRLGVGKCQLLTGVIFMDTVANFEKIADHLTNIAQSVVGELRWKNKL